MNKRINDIEFRYSAEGNGCYQLMRYYPRDNGPEYCVVIAFFRKGKEDYYMETVGDRYINAVSMLNAAGGRYNEVIELTQYAFSILKAQFTLTERIKEL